MSMEPSFDCNRIGEIGRGSAVENTAVDARGAGSEGPLVAKAPQKNADGKFIGRRKVKPKLLAVVTDACTGCAGAPVCQLYCPVENCMILVPAEDLFPGGRVEIDPLKCVGCRKCVTEGPEGSFLDGCPWNAIVVEVTSAWEREHGVLPY